MNTRAFVFNPYQENCHLVWEGSHGVVIDPGFVSETEHRALRDYMESQGIRLEAVLLTHAHFDHIYGVGTCVREYGVPVYMSPEDKVMKDMAGSLATRSGMPVPDTGWSTVDIRDGEELCFGDLRFEVITTPGHTPGCVSFLEKNDGLLFCGDTLFAGAIGRTDLPGGDYDHEIVSIMEKLMGMDSDVEVLPGHGPSSNIGHERTHNPFLQPFNEKDEETGDVEGIEISAR